MLYKMLEITISALLQYGARRAVMMLLAF